MRFMIIIVGFVLLDYFNIPSPHGSIFVLTVIALVIAIAQDVKELQRKEQS
jgi:hypothetical protein